MDTIKVLINKGANPNLQDTKVSSTLPLCCLTSLPSPSSKGTQDLKNVPLKTDLMILTPCSSLPSPVYLSLHTHNHTLTHTPYHLYLLL